MAFLGDAIEFGALEIVTDAGKAITMRLPETRVFEDLEPRLLTWISMACRSRRYRIQHAQGARLAIYDETGLSRRHLILVDQTAGLRHLARLIWTAMGN